MIREALSFYSSGQSDNGVMHRQALEAVALLETAIASFLAELEEREAEGE